MMPGNCVELETRVQEKDGVLQPAGSRWGVIAAIHVGPERLQPMVAVPEVRAIAGAGLEGDRYCRGQGTFWKKSPTHQVTLMEAEALEAAARDYGLEIAAHESRRNLLTRGMALNHLVGREFRIGEVRLRGMRLCEPCAHLERLSRRDAMRGLIHRGGRRAESLAGGTIHVGDAIAPVADQAR